MQLRFRTILLLMAGVLYAAQAPAPPPPKDTPPGQKAPAPLQVGFAQLTRLLQPPPPPFPPLAKLLGISGTVVLRLTIGTTGLVEEVEAIEGPELLRPTAEAYLQHWLFAPVLKEGESVRAQCDLAVPFKLQEPPPFGPKPQVRNVVLEVTALNLPMSVPFDLEVLRQDAKAWLADHGLATVVAEGADPENTLVLKLDLQTVRGKDGTHVCNVMARCTFLADRRLAANDSSGPQHIYFLNGIVGQRGESGFQDLIRETLRKTLGELLLRPIPPPKWPSKDLEKTYLRALAGAQRAEVLAKGGPIPADLEFSQIKIKKQPPTPPYPSMARVLRIQGTVVIEITINPAGYPVRVEAKQGPGALLMSAVGYALMWEFEPARLNGAPQWARFRLTMPYRLR